MNQNGKELFAQLPTPAIRSELFTATIAAIGKAQRRQRRHSLIIGVLVGLSGITAALGAFKYFIFESAQSGFAAYLSILFSDGLFASSYAKDLVLSLAESAPFVSLTLFLGAVLFVLVALKMIASTRRQIFSNAFAMSAHS